MICTKCAMKVKHVVCYSVVVMDISYYHVFKTFGCISDRLYDVARAVKCITLKLQTVNICKQSLSN